MDAFSALAEPRRREILAWLGGGERAAGEIAEHFAMSAPATSQHLRVLRRCGLVRVRPQAQRRIYRLDPKGLDVVDAWIERVRGEWNRSLDRLEDALAAESEKDLGVPPDTGERP